MIEIELDNGGKFTLWNLEHPEWASQAGLPTIHLVSLNNGQLTSSKSRFELHMTAQVTENDIDHIMAALARYKRGMK